MRYLPMGAVKRGGLGIASLHFCWATLSAAWAKTKHGAVAPCLSDSKGLEALLLRILLGVYDAFRLVALGWAAPVYA